MIEKYIYTKKELLESDQKLVFPPLENKEAEIHNVFSLLTNKNNEISGFVNFTNNTTKIKTQNTDYLFNTSIGTIQTQNGSLVINYSYKNENMDGIMAKNKIVSAKPTYKDGKYSKYDDINITVVSFENGNRELTIESRNLKKNNCMC